MDVENDTSSNQHDLINIAKQIEASCEFLTCLRRGFTQHYRAPMNSMKKYQELKLTKQDQNKFHYQGLANLIVQATYFLFSCTYRNIFCEIPKEYIRAEETLFRISSEKRIVPCAFYTLTDKQPGQGHFFQKISQVFQIILRPFNEPQRIAGPHAEHKNAIDIFYQNFQSLKLNKEVFRVKQKQFLACLQQTNLFRSYSTLLQIKNNSVLDHIKSSPQQLKSFRQCRKKDIEFVAEFKAESKKQKGDITQKLKNKEREIEANIADFFMKMQNHQKIQQEGGQKADKEGQPHRYRSTFILEQKSNRGFKQGVKDIIGETNIQIQEERQPPTKQPGKLQFAIEYSSEKNSICIRLMNYNVTVNVQTSDYVMYQSNILTFSSTTVNVELSDKLNQKTPVRKALAFKGASCFNTKEPPLQKILTLMDITMVASKVLEPELILTKVPSRDQQKASVIDQKIDHYTRLFMKCAKVVYSE